MKIKLRFLFIQFSVLSLAFWLYGCKSVYYMPTMQNVPDLKQQGDISVTGAFTSTGDSGDGILGGTPGAEIQAAIAVTNHIAITGGGTKIFDHENKGHMIDAGLGYFGSFSKNSRFSYGIYTTGSLGRVCPEDYFSYWQDSIYKIQKIDYDLKRIFIQPVINFDYKFIRLSGSARIVRLDIAISDDVIKTLEGVDCFDPELGETRYYIGTGHFYFLEPSLTLRMGWQKIKFHVQAACIVNLQDKYLSYNNLNINTGFSFRIPLKKASKPADF